MKCEYYNILDEIDKETKIDKDVLVQFLEYITKFQPGEYVYHEKFMEKFQFYEETSLGLLAILSREDILSKTYNILCPKCKKFDLRIPIDIEELEDVEFCYNCDYRFEYESNPYKYLVIYFRKK